MKNTITVNQIFNNTICPQCEHDSIKRDNEIHNRQYNIRFASNNTKQKEFIVLGSEVKLSVKSAIERNEDSVNFSFNLESNLFQYIKRFFHPKLKIGISDAQCFHCSIYMLEQFIFVEGKEDFPPIACFQEIKYEAIHLKRAFSIDKDFTPIGFNIKTNEMFPKEMKTSSDPSSFKEIFKLINKYKSFI